MTFKYLVTNLQKKITSHLDSPLSIIGGFNFMDLARIKKNLKTRLFGQVVHFESTVDSTNEWAFRADGKRGEIFLADFQTGGKGRLKRPWESPAGKNILLSLVDTPPVPPGKSFQLSLVAGVAFLEGLSNAVPQISFALKWPNDILVDGKKLGGILAETRGETTVIGVGLNVNITSTDFSSTVAPIATSLKIATDKDWGREEIIAVCLNSYESWREKFQKEGIKAVIAAWNGHNALVGKKVTVQDGQSSFTGTVEGLDAEGFLVVNANGEKKTVISGDVMSS